ncbi:MAG TPA: aldo/keto reductase [Stellaceae bacterium]|nr:aldo/keto reductase [Stellaceae bacterium]
MKHIAVKGTEVPALGLGTWRLSGRQCYDAVRAALELGYRHIDTAEMYDNAEDVGRAIRESGIERGSIFLTTKVPPGKLRAKAARRSAEESLRRMGLDHVDLLLIHWPSAEAPLGETLGEFAALKREGKTRFIGVSNFNVSLIDEAITRHGADLLCNQVEYHPYLSQRAVLDAVRKHGMMLTAYAPIAKGRAVGDATLAAIGRKYGKSAAQVSLRWLMEQDNVAAIPKAASREHLAANIAIFDFALAPEDRAAIDRLQGGGRLLDLPGWSPDWDRA